MDHVVFLIERYGLIVVFVNLLLDQAGLPIPSYPTLMIAAALGASNGQGLAEIVAAGTAGSLVADGGWYYAGRRLGRRILGLVCRISLSPDTCVRQTENLFSKVGPASLLVAKFIPGLTTVAVVLSGATGFGTLSFLALDAVGALLYVGVAVILGVAFSHAIAALLATLATLGEVGLVLVIGLLGLYLLRRWWQRQGFIRQLRMDRISVAELADMIDEGKAPLILDVRSNETRLQEGIIPGAVFAHPSDALHALASHPRDTEIVVYCSCPNEASAAVAARHLRDAGFRRIRPLLGGIEAWAQAGRPVARVGAGNGTAAAADAPCGDFAI